MTAEEIRRKIEVYFDEIDEIHVEINRLSEKLDEMGEEY